VPEPKCQEQSTLAHAVVVAINAVYKAKQELETAKADKANNESHVIALAVARTAERRAVSALDNHKKEHRCQVVAV
jgi:hypothetical protein